MIKLNPSKKFIAAPPRDSTCGCSECSFMKLISIQKIYRCLKSESPEITLDEELMDKARKPIVRMLEISEKLHL
jgi:quinolinate synthase